MWAQQQDYNTEYEEVHAGWFDYNVPPGYGHTDEARVPLQYGRAGANYGRKYRGDGLLRDAQHHLSEGDYHEQDEHELQAGMSKHHCTDIMCTVIFALALVGLGILMYYGNTEGDLRRLTHGYNFTGHMCGVDDPGRYLYWCQKDHTIGGSAPVELDLRHPICVPSCPTSYNTTRVCYRRMEKILKAGVEDQAGGLVVEETSKYVFQKVSDYVSKPFLDRYCLPEDLALSAQLQKALNEHGMTKLLMEFQQLESAVVPLVCAVIIAFLLGYVYIFLIDKFATCLVYTSMALVVVASSVTGMYLIISEFFGGIDGIPNTGDSQWNLITGFALVLMAFLVACFAFLAHNHIEVAVGCVQVAADCMFDMPTLLFEPLITLLLKTAIFIVLFTGFLQLCTVGKVRTMTLEQFAHTYEQFPDAKVSGVFRTFEYHESQQWYLAYYVAVSIWILCLITAISQFVIAYSVQLWYFTPYFHDHKDAPTCTLFRGYYIGAGYHLGSLAFGSLVVTIFQLARICLGTLAKTAEHGGNPCLEMLAKCLFCCISCYERCIEFLSKNAYMDIAINSTSFCTAASNAMTVISAEIAAVSVLNGATWVFKLAGYLMITSSGTFLTWIMVRSMWWFNNAESSHYISDPITVCFLAAIVCFAVSVGFMIVFDMVADTVLYCFAYEERKKQRGLLPKDVQYAPPSLHRLIYKHSDGSAPPHSKKELDTSRSLDHSEYDTWGAQGPPAVPAGVSGRPVGVEALHSVDAYGSEVPAGHGYGHGQQLYG